MYRTEVIANTLNPVFVRRIIMVGGLLRCRGGDGRALLISMARCCVCRATSSRRCSSSESTCTMSTRPSSTAHPNGWSSRSRSCRWAGLLHIACLTGAPCRLSHADPMVEAMLVLHGLILALLLDLRLCCQGFITCTLAEVCGTMSRTLTKPLQHPQGKAKGERGTRLGSAL